MLSCNGKLELHALFAGVQISNLEQVPISFVPSHARVAREGSSELGECLVDATECVLDGRGGVVMEVSDIRAFRFQLQGG